MRTGLNHFDASLVGHGVARLAAAVTAIGLAGCGAMTGPTAYPADWAPLAQSVVGDTCPDLNGVYANKATSAQPGQQGSPPSLTAVFGRMASATAITGSMPQGPAWTVPADALYLSIEQNAETLKVSFHQAEGKTDVLDFRRYHFNLAEKRYDDLYACYKADNGIRLRFMRDIDPHTVYIPGAYAGAKAGLMFMLKGTDGSLVVQFRTEAIGISYAIIGSHADFDSNWWRYPPVRKAD